MGNNEVQRGLFGEDYKPRDVKEQVKPKPERKQRQGQLFITGGLPGQMDFMGEMPGSPDWTKPPKGEEE